MKFGSDYFQNYNREGTPYEECYKDLGGGSLEFGIVKYSKLHNRRPKTFLDLGAAYGLVMNDALKQGIDAYGIEFSPVALENVRPEIKHRIIQGDVRMWLPLLQSDKFDIVLDTTAQYLPHVDLQEHFMHATRITNSIYILIAQFSDDNYQLEDKARCINRPMDWWRNQLRSHKMITDDGLIFVKEQV